MLQRQSESYVFESAALIVHESVGGAAVARTAVVGSSANDDEIAGRLAGGRLAIPVTTPLPHLP